MNGLACIRRKVWVELCMGFKILFFEKMFKSGGKCAQGQSVNHQVHEGDKRNCNRCPLIYEVRIGT